MKSPSKESVIINADLKVNLLLTSKKVVVNEKLKNVANSNKKVTHADLFHKFMGRG